MPALADETPLHDDAGLGIHRHDFAGSDTVASVPDPAWLLVGVPVIVTAIRRHYVVKVMLVVICHDCADVLVPSACAGAWFSR